MSLSHTETTHSRETHISGFHENTESISISASLYSSKNGGIIAQLSSRRGHFRKE